MRGLSAAVGQSMKNDWRDVALIQIWLDSLRETGTKSVAIDGVYSAALGKAITAFQVAHAVSPAQNREKGVVRPGSATFSKLASLVSARLRDVRLAWKNSRSIIAFEGTASASFKPEIPRATDIRLHHVAAQTLTHWLKHALVSFQVVDRTVTLDGNLAIDLKSHDMHYDVKRRAFRKGLPDAYYSEFLPAFSDPSYSFMPAGAGDLRFVWKIQGSLFKAPLTLGREDRKRLKYRGVPTKKILATDQFHDAVLAAAVKPWRQIKSIDPDRGRYFLPPGGIQTPNKLQRRVANEILDHYGGYSSNLERTYALIERRERQKDAVAPLLKISVGGSATAIVGVGFDISLIIDLNTNKEYLAIEAEVSAGLEIGFGLHVLSDALYQSIEDFIASQDFSSDANIANELVVGPLKFVINFKGDKVKMPPDFNWADWKIGLDDYTGMPSHNVSKVEADMKTGERIPRDAKKTKSRAGGRNKGAGAVAAEFMLFEADFGSVEIGIYIMPKVSSKLSVQIGPRYAYKFKKVFDIDYESGWADNLIRSTLRSILPERQFERYELFPPN